MEKIFSHILSAVINLLLYLLLILFGLALSYSLYQALADLNSWSQMLNLLADLQTYLPKLNSVINSGFSV
mgnify:CR=1 FL=1